MSPFVFHPSMTLAEGDEDECFFCQEWSKTHAPDCPWLSMPKIVAVLEADDQARELLEGWSPWSGDYGDVCAARDLLVAALGSAERLLESAATDPAPVVSEPAEPAHDNPMGLDPGIWRRSVAWRDDR